MTYSTLTRKTPLAKKGKSDTTLIKDEIQHWVREIVILRDGGCIFRGINAYDFLDGGKIGIADKVSGFPKCNGYRNDGELILQADHLLPNTATKAEQCCGCTGHECIQLTSEEKNV